METLSAQTSAELRDLFARMRVRIEELERENAELLKTAGPRRRRIVRYDTEVARREARRRQWREAKQRARLREAA